jgi:hypothetical protein
MQRRRLVLLKGTPKCMRDPWRCKGLVRMVNVGASVPELGNWELNMSFPFFPTPAPKIRADIPLRRTQARKPGLAPKAPARSANRLDEYSDRYPDQYAYRCQSKTCHRARYDCRSQERLHRAETDFADDDRSHRSP